MAALQAGGLPGTQGGLPPPGPPPPPPTITLEGPSETAIFVFKARWEIGPTDPTAIATTIENYSQFLHGNLDATTMLAIMTGGASPGAYLSTKIQDSHPMLVHSLGTYGNMVIMSQFRGGFFALVGDAYLNAPHRSSVKQTRQRWYP
jgi:hypothetical protein